MKVINLKQGSQAWLEWRHQGIGGSDISVILNKNPYKSYTDLSTEKSEKTPPLPLPITRAMQIGIDMEPIVRAWCNNHFKDFFFPMCIEKEEGSIFRASLDGISLENDFVIEIKVPTSRRVFDQNAPEPYMELQLKWNMFVSGVSKGYLIVWDMSTHTPLIFTYHADKDLEEEMRTKAYTFWKEKDSYSINNNNLRELLTEYEYIQNKKKILLERESLVKKEVYKYGKGHTFSCDHYKINYNPGRLSISRESLEKSGIDLSLHTKQGSPYYQITINKKLKDNT